jgi:pyruvate kinase
VVTTHYASTDEMMDQMNRALIEEKMVRPGDSVVFMAGQPIGIPGTTNMVKLHRIN